MLMKYNYSPLRTLQNEVDRLFDQAFFRTELDQWTPEVDILEKDDSIVLRAEMPGISPEDVEVTLENNELILSGEKKLENNQRDVNFHRTERSYGKFTRTFKLPPVVDGENVQARFENGVLEIILAKTENSKARKIQITGAKPKELKAKAGG